jgi:hypothetical protein
MEGDRKKEAIDYYGNLSPESTVETAATKIFTKTQ